MKTKYWIGIIVLLLTLSLGLSIPVLLPGENAVYAQILSDGELLKTVDLRIDQEFTVETELGCNTVTVRQGAIAVTAASCPDHYCMDRGFCSGGSQIVCLPNRLIIRFLGETTVDGVAE